MKIEYNDVIPASDLKPGDLAEVVQDPTDPEFNGRLVQMMEGQLILLGDNDYYVDYADLKVRRVSSVHAASAPAILATGMERGELGVIVDGMYEHGFGEVVMYDNDEVITVPRGDRLCADEVVVKILPPGTKIIL